LVFGTLPTLFCQVTSVHLGRNRRYAKRAATMKKIALFVRRSSGGKKLAGG
jgi:hypothetical protein